MATSRRIEKKKLQSEVNGFNHFALQGNDTKLVATFDFGAHVEALVFIARITVYAEVEQYHPEVTFTHKKVRIVLKNTEIKGVTSRELKMAKKIESLFEKKRG